MCHIKCQLHYNMLNEYYLSYLFICLSQFITSLIKSNLFAMEIKYYKQLLIRENNNYYYCKLIEKDTKDIKCFGKSCNLLGHASK